MKPTKWFAAAIASFALAIVFGTQTLRAVQAGQIGIWWLIGTIVCVAGFLLAIALFFPAGENTFTWRETE